MGWWRPSGADTRAALGARAEDGALRLLQERGLRLVARNFRCRGGELDLVLLDGATLVIVEVRARGRSRLVSAAESVDSRKQARIVLATQMFLVKHPRHAQRSLRFDVVAFDQGNAPQWIQSAFDAA